MAQSEQKQRYQRQLDFYNDNYAAPKLRKEIALAIVSNFKLTLAGKKVFPV
jgi:hypothetical protein